MLHHCYRLYGWQEINTYQTIRAPAHGIIERLNDEQRNLHKRNNDGTFVTTAPTQRPVTFTAGRSINAYRRIRATAHGL